MPAAGLAFRVILSHYCPGLLFLAGLGMLAPYLGSWIGIHHIPPSVFELMQRLIHGTTALKGFVAFLPIPLGVAIDELHHWKLDQAIEETSKTEAKGFSVLFELFHALFRRNNKETNAFLGDKDETILRRIGPEYARTVLDEYW